MTRAKAVDVIATIALLVITLLFGTGAGTAASVKGWLTLGGVRLGQPAELAPTGRLLVAIAQEGKTPGMLYAIDLRSMVNLKL